MNAALDHLTLSVVTIHGRNLKSQRKLIYREVEKDIF